ncbi:MAG: hypothetical protein ACD_83C00290G0001 [uncultured bacterium]|nr:MAG: hypothetical protein ACD_83C00290G0001 [uncultured bacterium]
MLTNLKILLDSSVLISGLNSSIGASAAIFKLAEKSLIRIITTPYIVAETKTTIDKKFPKLSTDLQNLIQNEIILVKSEPTKSYLHKAFSLIGDINDVPILAAAMHLKVDYLVTLDKKHFITDPQISDKSKIKIITPGQFMKIYRSM